MVWSRREHAYCAEWQCDRCHSCGGSTAGGDGGGDGGSGGGWNGRSALGWRTAFVSDSL